MSCTKSDEPSFWKALNSGIFIWLLSTLVGVFGAFALKDAVEVDARTADLRNQAQKIDLEIEGRLAQFAAWMEGVVEKQLKKDVWMVSFRPCVTSS